MEYRASAADPSDREDEVVTELRPRNDAHWPSLVAIVVGFAAWFALIGRLPWRWAEVVVAIACAFASAALLHKLRWSFASSGRVRLTPDAVYIAGEKMSLAEGRKKLKRCPLADRSFKPTLEALVDRSKSRAKAARAALPVRDLHALVSFLGHEGLRARMEDAAWAMVDRSSRPGSKGPELHLWVADGSVVRGELVGGPPLVGGYPPEELGSVTSDAVRYMVPTNFKNEPGCRAWLEPKFARTQALEPAA